MGEGSIQIGRLVRHLLTSFVIGGILDLAHQIDTVGNHDEDDSHIFGKRQQQITEILRFYRWTLGI